MTGTTIWNCVWYTSTHNHRNEKRTRNCHTIDQAHTHTHCHQKKRRSDLKNCQKERRGLRVEVEIKNATMKPSSWIWSPPVPQLTHTSADEVGWDVNTPSADSAYGDLLAPDGGAIQRGKNGGVLPRILRTLADAPRSPEQMAVFGGGGLLLSTGLALYLYMFSQINSVAAVTISLPSNIFFLSLLISEVEEGFGKHHGGRADVIN